CAADRFCVDDPVSLGQASVFVTRAALGDGFTSSSTPYFDDVDASHIFFRYIQKMREDGVECGCSARAYCDGTLTRGHMATIITRRFFSAPRCTQPVAAAIRVTSATYGDNYIDVPRGNVTQSLANACDGTTSCNYVVDYRVLGDPKPGLPKTFLAEWTCGS